MAFPPARAMPFVLPPLVEPFVPESPDDWSFDAPVVAVAPALATPGEEPPVQAAGDPEKEQSTGDRNQPGQPGHTFFPGLAVPTRAAPVGAVVDVHDGASLVFGPGRAIGQHSRQASCRISASYTGEAVSKTLRPVFLGKLTGWSQMIRRRASGEVKPL